MAGELFTPLTLKGMLSLDVTADKDYAKGDFWTQPIAKEDSGPHPCGFAMHAAKRGERLAVCVRCDLVDAPMPQNYKGAVPAFSYYLYRPQQTNRGLHLAHLDIEMTLTHKLDRNVRAGRGPMAVCGRVHHDHPANSTRVQVVWRTLD